MSSGFNESKNVRRQARPPRPPATDEDTPTGDARPVPGADQNRLITMITGAALTGINTAHAVAAPETVIAAADHDEDLENATSSDEYYKVIANPAAEMDPLSSKAPDIDDASRSYDEGCSAGGAPDPE